MSEEKAMIKPLVSLAVRTGKPPIKQDVQSLQKKKPALASIPWLKIKHQAWALIQAEVNKRQKVIKGLKL